MSCTTEALHVCPLHQWHTVRVALQVAEWKLKCEAIEKRETERREVDAKKHKEEVAFLENHGKLLNRWLSVQLHLLNCCLCVQ